VRGEQGAYGLNFCQGFCSAALSGACRPLPLLLGVCSLCRWLYGLDALRRLQLHVEMPRGEGHQRLLVTPVCAWVSCLCLVTCDKCSCKWDATNTIWSFKPPGNFSINLDGYTCTEAFQTDATQAGRPRQPRLTQEDAGMARAKGVQWVAFVAGFRQWIPRWTARIQSAQQLLAALCFGAMHKGEGLKRGSSSMRVLLCSVRLQSLLTYKVVCTYSKEPVRVPPSVASPSRPSTTTLLFPAPPAPAPAEATTRSLSSALLAVSAPRLHLSTGTSCSGAWLDELTASTVDALGTCEQGIEHISGGEAGHSFSWRLSPFLAISS